MNKKIDDTTIRNNLTKCIIEYFIKRKGSMDAKNYEDMSSQIVKFFPFESKVIFLLQKYFGMVD